MATAGYSGTPLLKKLGISPATKLLPLNEPPDYFSLLAAGSDVPEKAIRAQVGNEKDLAGAGNNALVHVFAASYKSFEAAMKKIQPVCSGNTALVIWVSWYKKASKIPTDITEDRIRAFALSNGLVDVKVCAVSDIWSGLKLVVPLAKR